ncbi:hypothetical protein FSP39_018562 [Pinctada imbricata]|uniref:VTT domain-containing protein n=1 Tax=Pinctada imbricata TaxID=66713 RepID=A0AA88XPT3_PINIB|nr:hypothetical protein FSP39_018562 [Pinctada imbricata]
MSWRDKRGIQNFVSLEVDAMYVSRSFFFSNWNDPDTMSSCTGGLSLHQIKVRTQSLLGESSPLDEVFLSRSHSTDKSDHHTHHHHEVTQPLIDDSEEEESETGLLESGPSCYQLSVISVVVICLLCFLMVVWRDYIKALLLWLESLDPVASGVIFLILFIFVSFPMTWGYILLMVATGYLYGYVVGPLVVIICGAIGIVVAHVIMKNFCQNFIRNRFYNSKMEAILKVVESDQGFKLIVLARLTPIPFGLQNGLFALTSISLWQYCLSSTLGLVPTTILNCYIGSTLRTMEDVLTDESTQATGYIILFVQIILTFLLLWFVVRKARLELKKTVESKAPEEIEMNSVIVHNGAKNKSLANGVIHT